jgi:hypothetical protein
MTLVCSRAASVPLSGVMLASARRRHDRAHQARRTALVARIDRDALIRNIRASCGADFMMKIHAQEHVSSACTCSSKKQVRATALRSAAAAPPCASIAATVMRASRAWPNVPRKRRRSSSLSEAVPARVHARVLARAEPIHARVVAVVHEVLDRIETCELGAGAGIASGRAA